MKISLSWLKDYVALPATVEEAAARLTAAGLEVEGVERPGDALNGVLVAQVREAVRHPNAEKLQVTQVDIGGSALLQVVCGAKNFKVGDKVPLATAGTTLPNGAKIGSAQLRGVDSFGMLCSAKELGLSEDAAGLLILPPDAPLGAPVAKALGLDDAVLEVNVTPNRPDALNHLGVARELAVVTHQPLTPPAPKVAESGTPAREQVKVRIEAADRCARYAARVVDGVRVGPSPAWMAERLKACGVRSINNVVDVTNYVLLELGHPLHAFDLEKVGGRQVVVRLARAGEKLTTLDGKERSLDADDLVIADAERAQALAGTMGGADSEVTDATRTVLLESAHFLPASVRRTAKRHGLHSEASHRFERGADVGVVPLALDRAAALLAELAGGTVRPGVVDVYPSPVRPREVVLRYAHARKLLGAEVPEAECRRILVALGFEPVREGPGEAAFRVPTARVDVEREEDLVEEIARIFGYDNIPAALPRGVPELAPEPAESAAERRLRGALSGEGLDEVVNYSFLAPRTLTALGEAGPFISLMNPLSAEQSVMRTSLFGGLLENLSRSIRHQVEAVRLYEAGRTYHRDAQGAQGMRPPASERRTVAGLVWGLRQGRTWTEKDARADFYDAKAAVEAVLSALHVEGARFEHADFPALHPRASARVVGPSGGELGCVGQLHPRAARALDVPADAFLFSLDLDALYAAAVLVPQSQPLPRFPAVLRDMAVVVPAELRDAEVRAAILEVGRPLAEEARIFDVYTGKPVPEGQKSLAYAIRYRAPDRTLTDAEVNEAHQRIVDQVRARFGASLRGANS
jgi:phenylalanyl-tRNA synthetase beta chain